MSEFYQMTSRLSFFQTVAQKNNLTTSVVRRLLSHKKVTDEHDKQYIEKSIKLLIKQLKRRGNVEEFEKVLTAQTENSKCIQIPRSFDNGAYAYHQDAMFHFLCCRIFRWPDIVSPQELKSIELCESGFDKSAHEICVNPYHYMRVKLPAIKSVMVPQNFSSMNKGDLIKLEPLDVSHSMSKEFVAETLVPNNATCDEGADAFPSFNNGSNYSDSPISTLLSDDGENDATMADLSTLNTANFTRVPYEECSGGHWCSISYYEMNQRVGEQFEATGAYATIDGFTDPSNSERFCLGLLTNVNRTFEIDAIRRHIGRGVKLRYTAGEVFAECLSKNPVFVQSPNCNARYGWHPATVCKIPPGCNLKIFANDEFAEVLNRSVAQGYETVFQLQRMCIIRMSFVKGWGREYRRQTITSTPCWIEIHLCGPLKWLDAVLQQMNGPDFTIHSNT